jgi:NAD(P)-dependent dehydrogenase (short-subunit alcohol dehydrogenase family)
MDKMFSLEGKVALVTGAAYGIGFAMAEALYNAGAKIAFNCRSQHHMDQALADYKAKGIEAHGYICDVTDEEQVKAMVADINKELGVIDILVNNAGIIKRIPMTECDVVRILLGRASYVDALLEVKVVLLAVYGYNTRSADVDDTHLTVLEECLGEHRLDWFNLDRSVNRLGTAYEEAVVHSVCPVNFVGSEYLLYQELLAQTISCVVLGILRMIGPTYLIVYGLCHCRH